MAGWIKISRDIQSHWIFQDSEKLKWWIDLLLLANFEDKEFNIKFKVFQCKRGQLLYSLKSLSQRWNVSKSVVNNFLELLRKQNMIETENETVTTRITICNYDIYQQIENANNTQTKRKRNANKTECDTTKEYKEVKEIQEENILLLWRENFDYYLKGLNIATNKLLLDKEWFLEREKFHPNLDIKLTIEKAYKDFWSKESGWKNKKSNKKTIEIDWKATYNNAIAQKINQVYKNRYGKEEDNHIH